MMGFGGGSYGTFADTQLEQADLNAFMRKVDEGVLDEFMEEMVGDDVNDMREVTFDVPRPLALLLYEALANATNQAISEGRFPEAVAYHRLTESFVDQHEDLKPQTPAEQMRGIAEAHTDVDLGGGGI